MSKKLADLVEKRILLIALPGFSRGIIKQMKDLGAEADYIGDKPNEGVVCKTLGRLGFKWYQKVLTKYYAKKIAERANRDFDYILVIRGEYTTPCALKLMRKAYPNAKIILYMWDGLHKQNTRGIENKWHLYDKVFTFDRIDYEANKDKISFLPLYYYNEYLSQNASKPNSNEFKYDLSFIGTGHEDRIKVVEYVMRQCKRRGMKCFSYFFIPHPFVFYKNKLTDKNFKNVHKNDVKFEMLPFEKLYQVYANSRCVIDVENLGQHGLTMRSIEVLGLKRKFITTNKDIVNYDFYNPNNILVIDRKRPVVDMSFFETPYEMLPDELYEKYSLKNWVLEVLK